MIHSDGVKHALVVKCLTEQIILVRMDDGQILSMSIPCRSLNPGSMLQIDNTHKNCPVQGVDGKPCNSVCRRHDFAFFIEQQDRARTGMTVSEGSTGRHVV